MRGKKEKKNLFRLREGYIMVVMFFSTVYSRVLLITRFQYTLASKAYFLCWGQCL